MSLLYSIIEVPDEGKVSWFLYTNKKCHYDGEVDSVQEAEEMIAAAKRLMEK